MMLDEALESADRLARPDGSDFPLDQPWWRQSLAHGAIGIVLLHTELAAAGLRPWQRVHDWLDVVNRGPVTSGASTSLFYGAPALAFSLASAASVLPGSYGGALAALDARISRDARSRVAAARTRMRAGDLAALAEFDTLRGLAGVGAYLLRREPAGDGLREILEYLVDLTEPVNDGADTLPGWWTLTAPSGRPDPVDFPGGHGNVGLAHGVCGPLALLGLAAVQGVTVRRHLEAVAGICAWLDFWRADTDTGLAWPYLVRRTDHKGGHARPRPGSAGRPPSWCYGTAGVARAQQLAALATGDQDRRRDAEGALINAVTDPARRGATIDPSLCHGHAGLARIAARAAADASEPEATRLRERASRMLAATELGSATEPGLLEGAAGVILSALAPVTASPLTGWDRCLLIA